MTLPVYNLLAPFVDIKTGKLVSPWNMFFQQLVQPAPAIASVSANPFTANANGTVIITGTGMVLTRGGVNINLVNGQAIIPISIGDTVSWATASSVQFLGS